MAKWKTDGRVSRCLLPKTLIPAVEGILNDVGAYGQKVMCSQLDRTRSSGRLEDSVTWQTNQAGSNIRANAKETDKIERPSDTGQVDIGTAVPYAPYVEDGTGAHSSPEGHDQFVEDLKDWFRREFNMDPEAPEGFAPFWGLYEHIVKNGTRAQPFVTPSFDPTNQYFKYKVRQVLRQKMNEHEGGRK